MVIKSKVLLNKFEFTRSLLTPSAFRFAQPDRRQRAHPSSGFRAPIPLSPTAAPDEPHTATAEYLSNRNRMRYAEVLQVAFFPPAKIHHCRTSRNMDLSTRIAHVRDGDSRSH